MDDSRPQAGTPGLRGAFVAAITPLQAGGDDVDIVGIESLVEEFLLAGLDGIFAMGTAGEGLLLDLQERQRTAEAFVAAAAGRLPVVVNCGAQTTRDTVKLARHAAAFGASAVSVIAPPYYALDESALIQYFEAAAHACSPVPFFVYIASSRTGYPVPLSVIDQLKALLPNLAGVKISDRRSERLDAYLSSGIDVFVGAESMIPEAISKGAAGAVSGFANAIPELIAHLVRTPTPEAHAHVTELREMVHDLPFHAMLRHVLAARSVAIFQDVRPPLRALAAHESELLDAVVHDMLEICKVARDSAASGRS